MRKYLILLLLMLSIGIQAQVTITSADMPSVGDTVKTRSTVQAVGINYQQTGANFTWDFSSLASANVGADTFISVSATPLVYQLAFNLPFDPNKSNLASPQADINLIPNLPLTDIMQFYRKATASYGNWGFGAKLAGVPVPIKFNAQDILYHFPLTATSGPDSTDVSFAQGVSGVGYLGIHRKRVNTVDGWGTMITPVGSYSTLRVKSVVTEIDTIHIDSLNLGFAVPRNYIEYKWLALGKKLPVMTVTTINLVPTFIWLDSAAIGNPFSVNLGQNQSICPGNSASITANAVGGTAPYFYIWNTGAIGQTITVTPTTTTTYSVTATDANFQFTTASITITVYPAPIPTITKNPDSQYGCSNGIGAPFSNFVFTAPTGFTMYNWSNGTSGGNANTINITYPSVGYFGLVNYWVQVADQHGCLGSDSTTIYWDICGSVNEINTAPDFTVYPNPTDGLIKLEYVHQGSQPVVIEIYNTLGSLVTQINPVSNSSNNIEIVDLKSFTTIKGLYFIRLSNHSGSKMKAVILE